MANYYGYCGAGGIGNGTQLPAGGTVQVGEVAIAQTSLPDIREPIQGGVLITGFLQMGVSTAGIGSVMLRQSTLGTTATTGAMLGTYTIPISTNSATIAPFFFQWVDYTGTYPIPSYQMTMTFGAGTGTVQKAYVTAIPLGG